MNLNKLLIGLAGISLLMASCELDNRIRPSSNVTTEVINVRGFTGIDVSDAFDVNITVSDNENVEIEANENLHSVIIVEKLGDVLTIKIKNRTNISGRPTLNVNVSSDNLSSFRASDATNMSINGIINKTDVTIDLTDASSFEGDIDARNLYIDISDASDMNLTGISDYASMYVKDASSFSGYSFETSILEADISDASDVKITVSDEIYIEASDASSLFYRGSAAIMEQNMRDASSVIKTN